MQIVQAGKEDILPVMFIYKHCVLLMNRSGYFNWNTAYPGYHQVWKDIEEEHLYVCKIRNVICGVMCLDTGQPDEYQGLDWKYGEDYMVVHRLAVHPGFRDRGIGGKMMAFAEETAAKKQFRSIRLDVLAINPAARRLYEKSGYERVKEIHLEYQKHLFICLEKNISQK